VDSALCMWKLLHSAVICNGDERNSGDFSHSTGGGGKSSKLEFEFDRRSSFIEIFCFLNFLPFKFFASGILKSACLRKIKIGRVPGSQNLLKFLLNFFQVTSLYNPKFFFSKKNVSLYILLSTYEIWKVLISLAKCFFLLQIFSI
jgi:hypothetical protein